MTGTEAIDFIAALREFKRACKAAGLAPTVVGFNSSSDLHKIEALAGMADTPVFPIVGGIQIEGIDLKRAWGKA